MSAATEYATEIEGMDFYKGADVGPLAFYALGVAGEAGEVAEKVKKYYRDGNIATADIALELGDVLWYVTRLAAHLGWSLEDIMAMNLTKLRSRRSRGTQRGSGDNR